MYKVPALNVLRVHMFNLTLQMLQRGVSRETLHYSWKVFQIFELGHLRFIHGLVRVDVAAGDEVPVSILQK